jgi:chorismate synthase
MLGNTFGNAFKLTSFGESHGVALGGVIDGCPAGLKIDNDFISIELKRRKPGQSNITTQRKEEDEVEFLSGIFEGVTTGTPIGFIIKNTNQKTQDYAHLKDNYRPSHADFTYQQKYGIRDYRGGGRSSARETVCRLVAGAIAKLILKHYNITINAFVKQVAHIVLEKDFSEVDLNSIENNSIRCPDETIAKQMITYIEEIKKQGDTVGGVIQCVINNVPVGLGEPVFNKLNAALGYAMLGINAVKGFELGSGFKSITKKGSELNDVFESDSNNNIITKTNNSGGIQGGISNGMPIYFNVAFKPVATVMQTQNSVNTNGDNVILSGKGRHDPCVLPRAVSIVESMAALVMVDFILLNKLNKL